MPVLDSRWSLRGPLSTQTPRTFCRRTAHHATCAARQTTREVDGHRDPWCRLARRAPCRRTAHPATCAARTEHERRRRPPRRVVPSSTPRTLSTHPAPCNVRGTSDHARRRRPPRRVVPSSTPVTREVADGWRPRVLAAVVPSLDPVLRVVDRALLPDKAIRRGALRVHRRVIVPTREESQHARRYAGHFAGMRDVARFRAYLVALSRELAGGSDRAGEPAGAGGADLGTARPTDTRRVGASGARLALADGFDPQTFWAEVRLYGATVVTYTRDMLAPLVDAEPGGDERNHPIRLFVGSAIPAQVWDGLVERFGPVGAACSPAMMPGWRPVTCSGWTRTGTCGSTRRT